MILSSLCSPVQPITNIVPLVLVLAVSLIKEAFEDRVCMHLFTWDCAYVYLGWCILVPFTYVVIRDIIILSEVLFLPLEYIRGQGGQPNSNALVILTIALELV